LKKQNCLEELKHSFQYITTQKQILRKTPL